MSKKISNDRYERGLKKLKEIDGEAGERAHNCGRKKCINIYFPIMRKTLTQG